MRIIGISGPAGVGKDTFGQMLHEELIKLGFHGVITHYADPLKFILKQYFSWNGEKDEAGRTLLQTVGTGIVRKKDPDFWVNFQIQMANFFDEQWDYMIIPDVRFYNEVHRWIESDHDAMFIGIKRDFESSLTEDQAAHISETELNDFIPDIIVQNNSFEELRDAAQLIATHAGI